MQAFLLRWPRGASRFFWSACLLYKIAGMSTYAGQPSKWAWSSMKGWRKSMGDLGIPGEQVLKSAQAAGGPGQQHADAKASTAWLPTTSMSTVCMVHHLAIWSALGP
eukprot:12157629-Prorocentrum_lima.AAC.1